MGAFWLKLLVSAGITFLFSVFMETYPGKKQEVVNKLGEIVVLVSAFVGVVAGVGLVWSGGGG